MESVNSWVPLHLKVLAYHHDRIAEGEALPLELLDLKTVLMPRQWFLNKLDPHGSLTVPQLRMILEPQMLMYKAVVLNGNEPPRMTVKKALNIYKKFHFLSRQPEWVAIPFSCSFAFCFPNCVCQDTMLFASLFNPKVRVPESWVTATVSLRHAQKPIRGTAGCKRRRLIAERACNEKTISSKVKFLKDAASDGRLMPEPFVPSSSDDDFEV